MAEGQRPRAVIAIPLTDAMLAQLDSLDLTVLPAGRPGQDAFDAALADAEGLLVSSNVPVDRATMAAAPRLRVISTMSVGLDHVDLEAARERGIAVTITPVLSDAVADLVMALVTMLSRRIPEGMRAVEGGGWKGGQLGSDLAGKVLLLVGFGRIGQAVARRALAANMRVRFVDPRDELPELDGAERVDQLLDGLREADVVSLHVDLNKGTRNLIGATELGAMKRTAILINTARGGVVDQDALAEALTGGAIAGAGLDVLRDEPPPADDPILRAPNVIVLPHIGSATVETRQAMAQCAVDNLRRELAPGAPLSRNRP
jgi:phosphoglycerate dehydrogenase-like enzyme